MALMATTATNKATPALRVRAETAYPISTPSPRVRIAAFAPFLRSHGVVLDYLPALTNEEYFVLSSRTSAMRKSVILAMSAARAVRHRDNAHDLLLVHRLRLPSPLPTFDPPRTLHVYDFDDALFLDSIASANHRFRWVKQEARRCIAYLARSKLVIAGNPFLADRASRYCRHVEVVPSCVDPTRYLVQQHAEKDVVTVGWIGSQSTSTYLSPIFRVMEQLNYTRQRAKLVVVGADPGCRAPWIEYRKWSPVTESAELAQFDIGVMPLPDTDWARGKCGYKLLQYFAAGVPAIANPIGVVPSLIGHDRGILATSAEDWRKGLGQLIADVSERRQRGALARQFAERHYSYQRWAPELARLLKSVPP